MRRFLLPVVLLLVAVVVQLTVLDRLPLPGGVAPDLVLLVVVALALNSGPMTGMICGFCAGLALDIAPPSGHLIGVYALVLCLLGYFCGLVSTELESSVLLPLAASAVGAAAGAALYAAVGIVLGNPDVTGPAVRHVLPLSVFYDVLLSPFVLFGVALAYRLAARLAGESRAPGRPPGRPGWARLRSQRAAPRGFVPPRPGRETAGSEAAGGWRPALNWPARGRPRCGCTSAAPERPRRRPGPRRARATGWPGCGSAASARPRHRPGPRRPAAWPGCGSAVAERPRRATGSKASTGNGVARVRFGAGRRGDAMIGTRMLTGGLVGEFGNGGRGLLGPSAGPRLFTRRSRAAGTGWARFTRRSAWGNRGAVATGSAPRRGTFSASARRKSPATAAAPRRGTFSGSSPQRRSPITTAPRRGTFGSGSSAKGSFTAGSPAKGSLSKRSSSSRGSFNGGSSAGGSGLGSPRRMRSLRRATFRGGAPGRGSALGRASALGRSRGRRFSFWRIGRKRGGGYQ